MRIRHLLPAIGFIPQDPDHSAFGGITMTAWQLALRQKLDNNVGIIGLSRVNRSFQIIRDGMILRGVVPWRWAQFGRFDLHYLGPVLRILALERADIIHCYTDPSLLYLPARIRVLHLENVPRPPDPAAFLRAISRADAVICCSLYVQKELVQRFPSTSNITYLVHNGGVAYPPNASHLREKLGINQDAHIILFVGAITPEKGLHILVEAFRNIAQVFGNVSLLVAGSSQLWYNAKASPSISDYERQLIETTRDLSIHFLGRVPQNEMGDIYHTADVFCCPSVWDEPFGIVNVEAMAAGLPVVASAVGGIPEIINNEVGRLVLPNDIEALAAALLEILQDGALRSRLANNAALRAREFTWNNASDEVKKIYSKIIGLM